MSDWPARRQNNRSYPYGNFNNRRDFSDRTLRIEVQQPRSNNNSGNQGDWIQQLAETQAQAQLLQGITQPPDQNGLQSNLAFAMMSSGNNNRGAMDTLMRMNFLQQMQRNQSSPTTTPTPNQPDPVGKDSDQGCADSVWKLLTS